MMQSASGAASAWPTTFSVLRSNMIALPCSPSLMKPRPNVGNHCHTMASLEPGNFAFFFSGVCIHDENFGAVG